MGRRDLDDVLVFSRVPCLSANEIIALACGGLGELELEAATTHLDGCDACRELVVAAAQDDVGEAQTLGRGQSIGRYIVLEPLGAGAMGVVLAAYDPELDRKVAIKLLRAELTGPHAEGVTGRLQSEARALARLSHPNVVTVHDVGRFGDEVFIAMELVAGRTLTTWLREAPRPWTEVIDVLRQVGEGLAAAHAAGVIHRDFKPDNVLVPFQGRPRVTDFGLARSAPSPVTSGLEDAAGPADLTRTGAITGTPIYMAPELLAGGRADESSDLFAFSVTAFEALFGRRPFAGERVEDLRLAMQRGHVAATGDVPIPAAIRAVVLRGLLADPARRWPSVRALLDALDHARPRSHRAAMVGAAAVVGLAAALLTVGITRERDEPCTAGATTIASLWDDARRDRVHGAFAEASAQRGALAYAAVDAHVTSWSSEWAAGLDDACLATHVRGVQSAELLDARGRCLDRARGEVAALVALFEHADAAIVDRAASVIEQTPELGLCANLEAMDRSRSQIPTDPEQRARHDALEQRVAEIAARASVDLPTRDEYIAVLDEAVDAGFLAMAARIGVRLGRAAGSSADSHRFYADTAARALAIGDDDSLARAWMGLAEVAGRESRLREAELAAQQADAAIERLGNPDELRALWHHKNCITYTNAGLLDRAQASCSSAVETTRVSANGDGAQLADTELSLGVVEYWRGQEDLALASMTTATQRYRRIVGDGHSLVDNAMANVAEVLTVVGRTDEALELLDGLVERRPDWIHLRDGVAAAHRSANDYAAALREDQQLVALCEPTASCPFWAFIGLGEDHLALHDTTQAARWFQRARALEVDMPPYDRTRLLLGLAQTAADREAARALAVEALAVIEPWERRYGSRYAALAERARRLAAA